MPVCKEPIKEQQRVEKIRAKLLGHKAWNKGLTEHTDERVRKSANATRVAKQTYRPWSEEAKQRYSQRRKELYSSSPELQLRQRLNSQKGISALLQKEQLNPTLRALRISKSRRSNGNGCSSIERSVAKELDKININFTVQEPICNYITDIFITPNIIIECDGDYWHGLSHIKLRDAQKNKVWQQAGYKVLRFTETQIKKDTNNVVSVIFREYELTKPHQAVTLDANASGNGKNPTGQFRGKDKSPPVETKRSTLPKGDDAIVRAARINEGAECGRNVHIPIRR